MKKFILVCFIALISTCAYSQVQPKIMVIPYTSEGQDIRNVLENDETKRIILTKIKEAFDNRGFSTVDFVARLKSAETSSVMMMDNQDDIKAEIINMSGADIYVEAEMICLQTIVSGQTNPETRVKIILTAYDAATGTSLSNKIGESGTFYTKDVAKLAMKAIESCANSFLSVMQSKFSDIVENGRSIILYIGFDESSTFTMETEVGSDGMLLQDEIELWVESHAYNGYYHIQGATSLTMIFDEIRIPLYDDEGKTYTSSRFGLELLKFFRSNKIKVTRDTKGNTLYFTIK
jgi:hypothetical protein